MFAQLIFDLGRVSDEIEFVDLAVFAQRHNGAGNEVRRTKVTAHRIEGDLHQSETVRAKMPDCKAKIVATSLRAWSQSSTRLLPFERQYLPPTIVAAGGADDVRRYAAPALRAFAQLRGVPPVCSFPRAQPHL